MAPAIQLMDPEQAVLLKGQVGFDILWRVGKSEQVLGKKCQGIGGVVVEVWYAGLNLDPDRCYCNEPHLPKANECYTTRHYPFPKKLHPDSAGFNHTKYAPQLCYSPNHWYRGKTTTNAEGRCFNKALSCCFCTH